MKVSFALTRLVFFLLQLALGFHAWAAIITWSNPGSGAWNNSLNWSPQQVPTANDHAIINFGTVTATPSATFAILDFSGGSIAGDLVVAGNTVMNWSGGQMVPPGSLTVLGNGVLNISGSANKYLYTPLTNWGNTIWTGTGYLSLYNLSGNSTYVGAIYNQSGALFDIQNDTLLNYNFGGELFNNAGTLRKSAGTNTTTVSVQFNNTGTVNVQSGTLALQRSGSVGGQYTTSAGATTSLVGGLFVQTGSPVFGGAGVNEMTGSATLMLVSDVIPGLALYGGSLMLAPTFQGGSITNLTLNATLTGANLVTGTATLAQGCAGTLTVAGKAVLNWTGGSMASLGSLTVLSNGVLNVSGNANKYLAGPLTNWGSVVWTGTGNLQLLNLISNANYTGAIYNQPGALFDIQNNSLLYYNYGYEFFNNAGTVRKSAGSGVTAIYPQFTNSGEVLAQTGVLAFDNAYAETAASTLAVTLAGTTPGTGYGQIQFATPISLTGNFTAITGGYRPNPGSSFSVLSFPGVSGGFTSFSGLNLGSGLSFVPQLLPTSFDLVAATSPITPAPSLAMERLPNGFLVDWPTNSSGWTLQTTTNLTAPWSTVPTSGTNGVVFPTAAPQRFFRLVQ